jgi:hypothetical protein
MILDQYVAALIDLAGAVKYHKRKGNLIPYIEVVIDSRLILESVQLQLGGKIHGRRNKYVWIVAGYESGRVAEQTLPFIITMKEELELVKGYWNTLKRVRRFMRNENAYKAGLILEANPDMRYTDVTEKIALELKISLSQAKRIIAKERGTS